MPSPLSEAFKPPNDMHGQWGKSLAELSASANTSLSSIKNPYYNPIDEYKMHSDEIKSIYSQNHQNHQNHHQNSYYVPSSSSSGNHNCDQQVAQLISCPICRQKIRRLLFDSEEHSMNGSMRGGGFDLNERTQNTLVTAFMGLILLFVVDRLMRK